MNKKHFILPIIVLALYLLTIWGMVYIEKNPMSRLLERHALFLQELSMVKDDREATIQVVERFEQDFKITMAQQNMAEAVGASQYVVDALTFGKKHCGMFDRREPCKVYTAQLLELGRARAAKSELLSGQPTTVYGTTYTTIDYIAKAITLLIEAFILSWLIGLAYNKRREIKEFYALNKFRVIMTIILFVVIIGPPLINDDMYFAAPWIWYILAPPLLLENLGLVAWLQLPLTILWFYTIAVIIDKVRKSR